MADTHLKGEPTAGSWSTLEGRTFVLYSWVMADACILYSFLSTKRDILFFNHVYVAGESRNRAFNMRAPTIQQYLPLDEDLVLAPEPQLNANRSSLG